MRAYAFLVTLALAASLSSAGQDKEKMMMKKWMMHKAIEGCIGEENSKLLLIKMKKAAAKCSGMDAPELELPFFRNPIRTISAFVPPPMSHHHRPGGGHRRGDRWMEEMVKKYFFKKMMAEMMDDDDDDDRDDDMMPFFRPKRRRYSRAVADELDLGDRLNQKLEEKKIKMEAKIGNMTCMLRECGLIDSDNNLNSVNEILSGMEEFKIDDPWLEDKMEKDVKMCYNFAQAIPKEMLEECMFGPKLAKVKFFKHCCMKSKIKTCMKYDMKKKLEDNFGPIEELVQSTGLKENELFPVVMAMLAGPEMDM